MTWSAEHLDLFEEAAFVADFLPDSLLESGLYQHWYTPASEPVEELPAWSPPLESVLRAAHAGGSEWSGPWPVLNAPNARVAVVCQDGAPRALARGDYATYGPGAGLAPVPGSELLVPQRRGCYVHEGWWRTWSEDWRPAEAPPGLSRIYFAPRLRAVAHLVSRLTGVLEGTDHPWSLKLGARPATLSRADGAVLYVPDEVVGELAERLAVACADLVREGTPPLTRTIAPGIAWCEDPGTGESHGEAVTRLVARAWRDRAAYAGLADAAHATFEAAGRDPRAPHLRPVGAPVATCHLPRLEER